jgi:hypothetical protein
MKVIHRAEAELKSRQKLNSLTRTYNAMAAAIDIYINLDYELKSLIKQ